MLALIVKLIWADTEIFSQAEIFKIFEGFVFHHIELHQKL